MHKDDPRRVQMVSQIARQRCTRSDRIWRRPSSYPVQWLADQRMTCRRQVNADLVWPPRRNINLHKGGIHFRA